MISSSLHLVGLRPRVYYTLTNFRGGGARPPWPPPLNTPMTVVTYQKLKYHTEAQPPLEQHGTKCAPWDKVPLNLKFNESIPAKHSQDSQTLKTMAMATLQPAGRPVFYTDGSVQDMKAGIGIAHNGMISSLRLNNNATIL